MADEIAELVSIVKALTERIAVVEAMQSEQLLIIRELVERTEPRNEPPVHPPA